MTSLSSDAASQCLLLHNLIDSHCHLDEAAFNPDRDAVIQRARAAGVTKIVVPAYSPLFWPRLKNLCDQEAMLYPAYGMHPLYVSDCRPDWLGQLQNLLGQAVALGEIGLDGSGPAAEYAEQLSCLERQLDLARELDLPVILHARQTQEELLLILRRYPGLRGVVHSFSGSLVQAQRLVDMGFYLGLGGAFTHARALRLQATIKSLPLEQILVETDAPWQSAMAYRGQRNEPGFLAENVHLLAHLLQRAPQALAEQLTRNTLALFHFQEKT